MQFLDDSLLPENQQPLVIQVAPYGPQFLPGDSDDIPLTMAEQGQLETMQVGPLGHAGLGIVAIHSGIQITMPDRNLRPWPCVR